MGAILKSIFRLTGRNINRDAESTFASDAKSIANQIPEKGTTKEKI